MQIQIKKLDGQKEEFSLEPSDSVMKAASRQRSQQRQQGQQSRSLPR